MEIPANILAISVAKMRECHGQVWGVSHSERVVLKLLAGSSTLGCDNRKSLLVWKVGSAGTAIITVLP